jgi:hypothetical protein
MLIMLGALPADLRERLFVSGHIQLLIVRAWPTIMLLCYAFDITLRILS